MRLHEAEEELHRKGMTMWKDGLQVGGNIC